MIVASWYPSPLDTVAGVFVEQQVRALARLHDVAVIAPDYRGWRKVARIGISPIRQSNDPGFPVLRPRVIGVVPYSFRAQAPLHAAAVRRGLDELARSWGEPDVLHAHVAIPGGHAAAAAARERNIPLVLTEHCTDFAALMQAPGSRRMIRATLREAREVVAVGPDLADDIRKADPSASVVVIGNAIDTGFYAEVTSPDTRGARAIRLLVVGFLIPRKGLHDLLDAVHTARANGVLAEVAFVGDGPLRSELEQRALSLGLREGCFFDGRQDRDGVRARLQWCDALVVASHRETFGVTVAEALAAGRPVIATRCGGPEFVMGPSCGQLVPVRDPGALAEAIADLASGRLAFDADVAREQMSERFGFGAVAGQISDIYDRISGVPQDAGYGPRGRATDLGSVTPLLGIRS